MVRTQDVVQFAAPLRFDYPLDLLPTAVVAVVMLALVAALLLVSVRRRDAE